ncbi:MAG TPA: Gfo/Idh/MocA family oxidoreductase [Streptosporangiaceae bacterium]|jgi:predicted dehydrogenase
MDPLAVAAPRSAAAAVGVIGLGEIGQVHVAAVRRSPVARLAAVADTAAELLQPFAAGRLPIYADAAGLIADPGVGTVCVCLPRLRLGMGPLYGGWRDSPAQTGGGLLMEAGVHRIYLALHWFGPVRGVHAVLDVPRGQGETFAVATLQFESGALGVIEANYYGPPCTFDDEIEIIGTGATLRLAGSESLYVSYRGGPALTIFRDGRWSAVPVPDDDWRSSVESSVMAYLDAVTAGREPPVSAAAGLETVQLIHRIYDSATILGSPKRRGD